MSLVNKTYCLFGVNKIFDLQMFLIPKIWCNLEIWESYSTKGNPLYTVSFWNLQTLPFFGVKSCKVQLFSLYEKSCNIWLVQCFLRKNCLTFPKLISGKLAIFHELPEAFLGGIWPLVSKKDQKMPLIQATLVIKSTKNVLWNHGFCSMWGLERCSTGL